MSIKASIRLAELQSTRNMRHGTDPDRLTRETWALAWPITRALFSGDLRGQIGAALFQERRPAAMRHALTAWEARKRVDPLTLTTDTAWGLLKLQAIHSAGASTP